MNKKLATTLTAIVGVLAMSGLAAATEHDPEAGEREDTIFNFGFDEENKVFVWGTAAIETLEGVEECTLEGDEPVEVTFGPIQDGVIEVPLEDFDTCGLSGVSVPGPNGQVNRGMFMKAINSVFEGNGRGCINRHIARSELGKGDQQIQVPDVDPESPELAEGGTINFNTVLADCRHGNDGSLTGQEKAAAKKAAAAEKERGNSNSAPGRSGSSPGKPGLAQSNPDPAPGKSGSAPGHNK